MRRFLSLATLAVFGLIFAACGGGEGGVAAAAGYDQAEFQKAVLDSPPAGLTVNLANIPADDIPGIDSIEATVTVNTSPPLLVVDITLSGSTSITLNVIATDDAAYMNVGQGWLKAPPTDDLADMAEGFGGGFNPEDLTADDWVYKAEVPCGDDTCWQVESEDGVLMNLRRDDYTPLSATIVADGVSVTLDILHWGDAVAVELPTDAREVTSEELMFSLLGALMPLIAGGL